MLWICYVRRRVGGINSKHAVAYAGRGVVSNGKSTFAIFDAVPDLIFRIVAICSQDFFTVVVSLVGPAVVAVAFHHDIRRTSGPAADHIHLYANPWLPA